MSTMDNPEKGISGKNEVLLQTKELTKHFGGVEAVSGFNMEIYKREILALIGPNGAGKTTLFNLITGFYPPTRGKLIFKGEDITHLKPHEIAKKGIVRSFQSNILFMDKTVRENVLLGFHSRYKEGIFKELWGTKSFQKEKREMESKAEEIMHFLHLLDLKDQLAKNLPHGYQRMLGVAVAFAVRPELLLLDEPVTGMNDDETATMMKLVRKIRDQGVTILLVEHDMKAVMGNCERIVVMEYGKKIAEGVPAEITCNQRVIEAYLGMGVCNA